MVDPENDPRVVSAARAIEGMVFDRYSVKGNEALILARAMIDSLSRPPPGEIVVTDEMLEEAMTVWHTAAGELREMLRDNYRAMAALDPRNRPVEPVAGDAVEAAAREIEPDAWRWRDGIMRLFAEGRGRVWTSGIRTADGAHEWCLHDDSHIAHLLRESLRKAKVAIAAADRVRGHAYVTWRRPEEFIRTLPSEPSRTILIVVNGGVGYENYRDIREHRSEFDLSDTVLAWAEKVQMPEWVAPARTATDGEHAPGHTDLMVSPESIDKFLQDNPPPDESDPVHVALTKAWHIAKDGCLPPPDGGSPTTAEYAASTRIANRIRALMPDSSLPELDWDEPSAAPSGTTPEAPGAAVLAGGAIDPIKAMIVTNRRCGTCLNHTLRQNPSDYPGQPSPTWGSCRPKNIPDSIRTDDMQIDMGTNCPAWALRETRG